MYTFDGRIRYSEVDENGTLTIEKLIDYFQDCSTFQSESLGVGVGFLKQYRQAWVVNTWQIEVSRYPKYCEHVTIGTFPYDFKAFLGYRNFFMQDDDGNYLAKANTIWTLLNMDTAKPVKPSAEHRAKYITEEKLDMEYRPRKISVPEDAVKRDEVEIKKHHLDTNHHVNNGQFIKIAIDSADISYKPSRLRCEYKKQAFSGDILTPYTCRVTDEYGALADVIDLRNADGDSSCVVEVSSSGFNIQDIVK